MKGDSSSIESRPECSSAGSSFSHCYNARSLWSQLQPNIASHATFSNVLEVCYDLMIWAQMLLACVRCDNHSVQMLGNAVSLCMGMD